MSSDSTELHDLLTQLHRELKHTARISDRDRRLLAHISDHVEEVIEEQDASFVSLTDSLKRALADTESKHPQLAAAMKQVIDSLSNMGI